MTRVGAPTRKSADSEERKILPHPEASDALCESAVPCESVWVLFYGAQPDLIVSSVSRSNGLLRDCTDPLRES